MPELPSLTQSIASTCNSSDDCVFPIARRILRTRSNQWAITKLVCLLTLLVMPVLGCGTTTKHIATEQLLMSDAVDNAIAKIDFQDLKEQDVYLDSTYIRPVKAAGFVNSHYVISALRQQLTAAGCRIHDARDQADIIVEPRIGTLGADGHEVTFGIPKTNGISAAAAAISGSPIAALPEISFAQSNAQMGVAKIFVFAYHQETREPVWQSGIARAESNSSSTWIFGAGPIQRGSIYKTPRFAGRKLNHVGHGKVLKSGLIDYSVENSVDDSFDEDVLYQAPHVFAAGRALSDDTRVAELEFESSGEVKTR